MPDSVQELVAGFESEGYIMSRGLSYAVWLALRLDQPLLLEGPAGVGKTEVAHVLSACTGHRLVRLQCYEGIDPQQALYDWDYAKQLLHIRLASETGQPASEDDLYSEAYLLRRPLLEALEPDEDGNPAVLLVDELDRADGEFEALLLEVLSDYAVTIPEIGTVRSQRPPVVVLTSNRTRELSDALRRRCLYHWLDHPSPEEELRILHARLPRLDRALGAEITRAVSALRALGLEKPPGVAETINWGRALVELGVRDLDEDAVEVTMGALLKHREDVDTVHREGLASLIAAGE